MGQLRREPRREDRRERGYEDKKYYRDDYGVNLTNQQYEAAEKSRTGFEAAISKGRGEIATGQGSLDKDQATLKGGYDAADSAYSTTMGSIKGAGKDAMKPFEGGYDKWAEDNTGMINVYSDGKYEGSYRVSNSTIEGMSQQAIDIHDEEGDWLMDFGEDSNKKGEFQFDVHGYGKSAHEQLFQAQDMTRMSWDAAYGTAQKNVNDQTGAASERLNTSYADQLTDLDAHQMSLNDAQSSLDERSNTLSGYETDRAASLNGIRRSYSKRLERIRETIMGGSN